MARRRLNNDGRARLQLLLRVGAREREQAHLERLDLLTAQICAGEVDDEQCVTPQTFRGSAAFIRNRRAPVHAATPFKERLQEAEVRPAAPARPVGAFPELLALRGRQQRHLVRPTRQRGQQGDTHILGHTPRGRELLRPPEVSGGSLVQQDAQQVAHAECAQQVPQALELGDGKHAHRRRRGARCGAATARPTGRGLAR
eukprot:scaffold4779_cov116-Isochrysis_galbana.AAC.11